MITLILWLSQVDGASGGETERMPGWIWPEESTLPMRPLLIVATVVVVILGLLWARRVAMAWWRRTHPLCLFWRIAGELGLSHGQRRWLWKLARRSGLSSPITLLVCESTLRVHVANSGRTTTDEAMTNAVAQRLFGA